MAQALYAREGVEEMHESLVRRSVNGNCRWNRDTARTLSAAGSKITSQRDFYVFLIPMLLVEAIR